MLSDPAPTATDLAITVGDRRLSFRWDWLRDHSRDSRSFHADSGQRLVPPSTVVAAGRGSAEIDPDGESLTVTWADGTEATFDARFLASVGDTTSYDVFSGAQRAWTATQLRERMVRVPYEDYVHDDRVLSVALRAFRSDGVFVVDGVPTDLAGTRAVLERIGYVRMSIFGDVWRFGSDGELADTASTSLEISPHTDGTYSRDAPGLLGLHCHRAADTGGENVLVDGLNVAEQLVVSDAKAAEALRAVEIPGRYVGDGADLVASRPAFRHERDRLVQVSYNNHDRAPFALPPEFELGFYPALVALESILHSPAAACEVRLEVGQMILIDNWRVLHGRRAFDGAREMAGGYLNREDVESALRKDL